MVDLEHVGEGNFQKEVLESTQPVLVEFSAVWCGPCKMLEPILKQLAQEWEGKARVFKLDADDNPDLAMQYQVMGLPTMLLFVGGEPKERLTGYQPKDRILSKVGPFI